MKRMRLAEGAVAIEFNLDNKRDSRRQPAFHNNACAPLPDFSPAASATSRSWSSPCHGAMLANYIHERGGDTRGQGGEPQAQEIRRARLQAQ